MWDLSVLFGLRVVRRGRTICVPVLFLLQFLDFLPDLLIQQGLLLGFFARFRFLILLQRLPDLRQVEQAAEERDAHQCHGKADRRGEEAPERGQHGQILDVLGQQLVRFGGRMVFRQVVVAFRDEFLMVADDLDDAVGVRLPVNRQ